MHKILISAYGCEPFVGSESGVGWHWVLEMAKNNRLFVITRENNREKIEPNIPNEVRNNITFYYYDAPAFFRKLKHKEKGLYFYYTIWQIGIIKIIRRILEDNEIDYTMHLSFGSFWMPTFLPFFKTPFIWGPLGGGDCVPISFLSTLPLKDRLIQSSRYFLKASSWINPLIAIPSKKAVVILSRTEDSALTVPPKYRNKVRVVLETAMSDDIFEIKKEECHNPIELIYTGRLIPIKNVLSIVKAMHQVPEKYKVHLSIIGKGEDRPKIEKYIEENSLKTRITIYDAMPRDNVLNMLAKSDIYLFPSLHEGGSWALMEAMSIGLPVICLDCTGMHTITSEDSAIRIIPNGINDFINRTAESICMLIDNPQKREKMGHMAKNRMFSEFRWEDKGIFMEKMLKDLDDKK